MNDTLLLISIGPVQEFIASARKLRDLFFGSYVLSELSKTVARTLHDNGADLVFPAIEDRSELDEGSELNVANKIMAKVESLAEADRIQKAAKSQWLNHIKSLSEKTLDELFSIKKIKIHDALFRKQIGDYGEFFAVWTDIAKAGGYKKARDRVEYLLSSRKNLREFSKPDWDGRGIAKNSLDGRRESVIPAKAPEIVGLLKKNEKLDAMGCIKRFYPLSDHRLRKQHFDDLSDVTIKPWLEGIAKDDNKMRAYLDFCGAILTNKTKRKAERPITDALDQRIVSDLFYAQKNELAEALGDEKDVHAAWNKRGKMIHQCGEPNRYAVVLVGDGDRMGKMIDAIDAEAGHIDFTREMSRFAVDVRSVVKQNGGSLIYAGGDDVMAYLPLHTAVPCADALRRLFYAIMKEIHGKLKPACEIPTFSIGMAIVHHSFPLDQALDLARSAEKAAKTTGGRNALAIIQSKRSGQDIEIAGKWADQADLPGIARRIETMIALYNKPDPVLPTRLGYQLREARISAGDTMAFSVENEKIVPQNAAAALVKRIFDQKNDGDPVKNKELLALFSGRTSIRGFSDELVVANQIARAVAMAGGKNNR